MSQNEKTQRNNCRFGWLHGLSEMGGAVIKLRLLLQFQAVAGGLRLGWIFAQYALRVQSLNNQNRSGSKNDIGFNDK